MKGWQNPGLTKPMANNLAKHPQEQKTNMAINGLANISKSLQGCSQKKLMTEAMSMEDL